MFIVVVIILNSCSCNWIDLILLDDVGVGGWDCLFLGFCGVGGFEIFEEMDFLLK